MRLGPGLGPSPSIDRFEFTAPSELEATPLLSKAGKGAVLGVGTAIFLGGVIFAAARCSPSTGARCISMPTSGAAAAAMIAGGLGVNLVALVLFAVDRRK